MTHGTYILYILPPPIWEFWERHWKIGLESTGHHKYKIYPLFMKKLCFNKYKYNNSNNKYFNQNYPISDYSDSDNMTNVL